MRAVEPARELTAVDERKTAGTIAPSGGKKTEPGDRPALRTPRDDKTLIGRGTDLDRIGTFISGIPQAGGPLVLTGEPGVGKTTLLAAARSYAEAADTCVLAARAAAPAARRARSNPPCSRLSNARSRSWRRRACRTSRSGKGCSCPRGPSPLICIKFSRSWE